MSLTLKTGQVKVNVDGTLQQLDVVSADTATEIATIQTATNTIVAKAQTAQTTATKAVSEAQIAADNIESQKDTMIASIASVAGQGTDTTLTQSGVAADAKIVGNEVSELKKDFANISPANLNYQKLNITAISEYLGATIQYNKNIGGYSTSTYLPSLADGDDIVVTIDTATLTAKGITSFKWEKGTSNNAYVAYTAGVTAFNSAISPSSYLAPSSLLTTVCFAISTSKPYILVKANLENASVTKDITRWIDLSDIKSSAISSIESEASALTTNTYIAKDIINGSYGAAGDGSVLVNFTKITEETNAYISITGDYTFSTVQLWSDSSTWTLYHTYYYDDNKNENGLKITLPVGCGMIQIRATAKVTSNITVKVEKILISKRLDITESRCDNNFILASLNMFDTVGAIGDSFTAGSAKHSDGTWTDVTNQSWIGTMAKRSGVTFNNYGKGGATTASYITDMLPTVLSATANDCYFFALGQNDCGQSVTIGTVDDINDDDYTQNPATFYGNYGRIIQQIKNHAPKARLIMVKIHLQGGYLTYSEAIAKIATHYGIPCIDPFDDEYFNSALYRNYKLDGHPTALGYSMMGIAMERLFSKCVTNNMSYFLYSTIG